MINQQTSDLNISKINNKTMRKKAITLIMTLMFMQSLAFAAGPGEFCLIDAECPKGYLCKNVCVENFCNDGKCVYMEDCFLCPQKGYGIGDCTPDMCGIDYKKCSDKVCDLNLDCYCPNSGDCFGLFCLLYFNKLYVVLGLAAIILIIYLVRRYGK